MARNAYEIRLDTLSLARDILSENRHIQLDVWKETKGDESVDSTEPPPEYGVSDVLAEAEKLYDFIQKGKGDSD
ncbi:hypothetical protein N9917_03470 [Deltaproteobacteria bacterium]|nr:hypothetical protein [Deltaproteobacteria bacterium]